MKNKIVTVLEFSQDSIAKVVSFWFKEMALVRGPGQKLESAHLKMNSDDFVDMIFVNKFESLDVSLLAFEISWSGDRWVIVSLMLKEDEVVVTGNAHYKETPEMQGVLGRYKQQQPPEYWIVYNNIQRIVSKEMGYDDYYHRNPDGTATIRLIEFKEEEKLVTK
jgi:hypothetical protein